MEIILNHLLCSISETLQSQFSQLVSKHLLSSSTSTEHQKFPSLACLPSIWAGNAASQVIILITLTALELATQEAMVKSTTTTGGLHPLSSLLDEIYTLIGIASGIIRGDGSTATPALISNHITGTSGQSTPVESHSIPAAPRAGYQTKVARGKIVQVQNVLTVLLAAVDKVKQLIPDHKSSGEKVDSSFTWQASLHFNLTPPSTRDHQHTCTLTTLSGSLLYGFCYTGSLISGLSLGPVTERGFVYLLQLMKQHCSALVTGQVSWARCSLCVEYVCVCCVVALGE